MDGLNQELEILDRKPAAGQGQERTADAPALDESDEAKQELEKKIEAELVDLVKRAERECDSVRRRYVKKWLEAEEFWKGNHHVIWNPQEFRFRNPTEIALELGKTEEDLPRYQYVTNIYQAYGLSVISAISQRLPKVRFQPKSAKKERDIATARAASNVAQLIEQNNNLDLMAVRCAYLMWTQGFFAAYVRYVLDKDFGTQEVPEVQLQTLKVAEARYLCSACGVETPTEQFAADGLAPVALACPHCGYQMSEADFRPEEYGEGPVVTGIREYPNGQEVITIYGALNIKVMPHAQTQKDSGYLILDEEQHKAAVRAAYPKKAKRIGMGGDPGGSAGDETNERNARISLVDGAQNRRGMSSPGSDLLTLKRAWLRDWMFWACDSEEVRNELFKRFPDGALVVMAGNEFLEARPENLDDHWEVCSPMPGQGAYRESVGASTIPLNRRLNDAHNIAAEHIEFGSAPPVFCDTRFISMEALKNRRMQPANFFPVNIKNAPQNTDMSKLMYQPQLRIDGNIYQYGRDLVELAQVTSGAMPSLFGGSMEGMDTFRGYAMARNQSLGKLNLFWRAVKQFHARLMLKAVECFRNNRTDDYEHVIFDKSGDYASQWIHLEDLKGNITAHPEADEDFPATFAEVRENFMMLMERAPEQIQRILMHPANAPMLRKFLALPDVVLPMEDDREKQYREIDQLLQGAPIEMETIDPATGQVKVDLQPTVMPDAWVDDHDAHIVTLQEYCVSDKGLEQKKLNPAGYANLMAHVVAHLKAKAQMQASLQLMGQQAAQAIAPPQPAAASGSAAEAKAQQTVGEVIAEAAPEAAASVEKVMSAPAGPVQ